MKPVATATAKPWQPGIFRNAPILSFALLGASVVFSGLALFIVHRANNSPVEGWPITPSVYLSILATLSGISLRSAFQEGAETYWWSLILSNSGVRLRTLHHVWELKHDALSRFKISGNDPEPVLRMAGIVLLLMAANGPLLQRAVAVNFVNHYYNSTIEVAVRQEPMWNLTAKYYGGQYPMPAAYQDEFASVVAGLNQRRPMRLSRPGCPTNTTCTAVVTIAGFSKACKRGYISILTEEVPILSSFQTFTAGGDTYTCQVVGGNNGSIGGCRMMPIDFQLDVKLRSYWQDRAMHVAGGPGPEELRWQAPNLYPTVLKYTSYFKEDSGSDVLTIQRCNFTSAYINLPIQITDGDIIRMEQLTGPELSQRDRGIESIPSPIDGETHWLPKMLVGFERTMQDLYAGFSVYNERHRGHAMQGAGPRQFIKQTDIKPILLNDSATPDSPKGFHLSFLDPLESFTETLHELSLRYALEKLEATPERLKELSNYFSDDEDNDKGKFDKRWRALDAMKTVSSQSQRVKMRQIRTVAVYQTNSVFAFIAVGLSTILSVLVALLLTGWRRCGRPFSMSPLEIAKAFDAPLLRQVGSNTPASQIAKDDDGSKVRYGEIKQQRRGSTGSDTIPPGSLDTDCEIAPQAEDDSLMEPTGARLTVDLMDRVVPPVKGKVYV